MRYLPVLLLCCVLLGCSRQSPLPTGVSLRVVGSEVIITLDDKTAVQIRQNKPDPRVALVASIEGRLSISQLERGGSTPRSMDLISRDKAKLVFTSGEGATRTMIFDEDGDGLPDLKAEGAKGFRCVKVEWAEVPKRPRQEPNPALERTPTAGNAGQVSDTHPPQ